MVGARVLALCRADHGHRGVHRDQRSRVAVLASGHHRLDGLALLWAAVVFAHAASWKNRYWLLVAFPLLWSYIAVIHLDNFVLAAVPAVVFLSAATLWTGIVLLRYRREETRGGSTLLGWTFLLWGLHHLDYTFLRARGAWSPWGYYIDILFLLAVGAGILLLVNADLASRLQVRTSELEALSRRMVRQHEEERRRLSLELHDETAQVFAAVKMQLGVVRERVAPEEAQQPRPRARTRRRRHARHSQRHERPASIAARRPRPAARAALARCGVRRTARSEGDARRARSAARAQPTRPRSRCFAHCRRHSRTSRATRGTRRRTWRSAPRAAK